MYKTLGISFANPEKFLQPKYTMHGFEWKDQRGIEGTGFVRALRSLLTTRLPQLIPSLKGGVQDQVATEISNEKVLKNGQLIQKSLSIES